MRGRLSLWLAAAALFMLCGCSSYEVTASGEPAPSPKLNGPSLDVEVAFAPDNIEPAMTITFSTGEACWVRMEVLNATGYRVKLLIDNEFMSGGTVQWDGANDDGEKIKSGIYIYRLNAGGKIYTQAILYCLTVEDCEKMTHEN